MESHHLGKGTRGGKGLQMVGLRTDGSRTMKTNWRVCERWLKDNENQLKENTACWGSSGSGGPGLDLRLPRAVSSNASKPLCLAVNPSPGGQFQVARVSWIFRLTPPPNLPDSSLLT